LALSLALCLALLPAHPLLAQGTVVRPDPTVLEIGQGQVETVNIILENAQDVYAIDVQASFDPAAVEVVDADAGRDGVQMIPGDFVKPDFAVRNTADNAAGTLQYVITQVNPTEPVSGTGTVFSIQLRGKVLGAQSELKIDSVQIANRRGVKLSVQPQDGTLTVVPPKPETPTPVPAPTTASTTEPQAAVTSAEAIGTAIPTPTPVVVDSPTPVPASQPAAVGDASSDDSRLLMIAVGGLGGTILLLIILFFVLRRRRTSSPSSGNGRSGR